MLEANRIGTNAAGTAPIPNLRGVEITVSASGNTIGGTAANAGNLISGNTNDGIFINGANTNTVQQNRIGTNAAGTAGLGNGHHGVEIASSTGNIIGGVGANAGNVVSGNTTDGIWIGGSDTNTVQQNRIGTNAAGSAKIANGIHGIEITGGSSSNLIGGAPALGNVISGNNVYGVSIINVGTSTNRVAGNIVGLDATGTADLGNTLVGVAMGLGATGNIIGEAGGRNIISGNDQYGVRIVDGGTNNNLVQLNYIGLDITGALALPNSDDGVRLEAGVAASGNVIGGVGLGNVISGNTQVGVRIIGSITTTSIVDNIIGRNATDTGAVPNGAGGVRIEGSSGNTIGGTGASDGNIIGGNSADGVAMIGTATANAVLRNSIFSNGGLGIDLGDDGPTANDVGDGDAGHNNFQNFPVLSGATTDGAANVDIAGSLNSAASTTYRVEFFASSAPDPTGFGEGRRYLGFTNVATDVTGNAIIGVTLGALVAVGEFVTATATDPSNNTSEFAANVTAMDRLVVTTTADTVDGTTTSTAALIADVGADGRISLREAIQATNATAGTDTIRFEIPLTDAGHLYYQDDAMPGLPAPVATALADAAIADFDADYPTGFARSWYRIQLSGSALPTLGEGTVIDATTQPGYIVGGPVVELDGSALGAGSGLSMVLATGPSTIRGLVINGFPSNGLALRGTLGGHLVTGNYIGTDVSGTAGAGNGASGIFIGEIGGAATTIGGDTLAERNIISGNGVRGLYLWAFGAPGISSQIRIQGNYIGTDVTGMVGLGVQVRGMTLEYTSGHLIGGPNPAEGNLISGNAGFAIELNGNNGGAGTGADNNVIEGNLIGTDRTGTAPLPNTTEGIIMFATSSGASSASNNTIRGNVIAAATGGNNGIRISGTADNNLYDGNFIGTDSGSTIDLGNTGHGILILDGGGFFPTGNTIQNNVIRFNDLDAVRINGASTTTTLTQNAIWSNDGLGIDLSGDGVTSNDADDADAGPNDLLNWPFIYLVSESGGTLTVDFALDLPAGSYRIEFFKNPSGADPSGYGEGEVFASSRTLTHAGAGSESFSHSFAGAVGEVVTATTTFCTDGATCAAFGNTSEFSRAFTEGVTAVQLTLFTAVAGDGTVDLHWQTASELDNLGFHLYRSSSGAGPYERITGRAIPGLGSSPVGANYSYRDTGLANGITYYYKLEDIETTGRTTFHGPVVATPEAGASSTDGDSSEDSLGKDGDTSPARITYGDPSANSLKIVRREHAQVVLELETAGFYAEPQEDGSVRLEIPGFEALTEANAAGIPVTRTWVEAIAGRKVKLASVRASGVVAFTSLRPSDGEIPEIVATPDGTVHARRSARGVRRRARAAFGEEGLYPSEAARVVSVGFQGDVKKALVELAPLRWDASRGQLLLAGRLVVRIWFRGREPSETDGVRGRGYARRRSHDQRTVVARLGTTERGLYSVRYEEMMRGRRGVRAKTLRLSRQGEAVAFRLQPNGNRFKPGSTLYFVSEGARANPFGNEAVYELEVGAPGEAMAQSSAAPSGEPQPQYWHRAEWEENRYYQAALVDAPDLWLWDLLFAPETKSYPIEVNALAPGASKLSVWLQGASDFPADPDHHVRVYVNGSLVEELSWNGKQAKHVDVELAPGLLREGDNVLQLENVGDTEAVYSMVMLDRYAVEYPRVALARDGQLRGRFRASGAAELSGLVAGAHLLDMSRAQPSWLLDTEVGADGMLRFRAEAGRSYLAVSPEAVYHPAVTKPRLSRLKNTRNRADYLVIGPEAFLQAAIPLLEVRRGEGLKVKAVSIEEVYSEFGFGEATPEALKDFLSYAYHKWRQPSPRYVVLLGDATYDFEDHLQTGVTNQVPPRMVKTSYLWTASDPSYAAVNGEDILPDFSIGRLPAATVEQVQAMVEKIVAYETGEAGLDRSTVVLVADNPDRAGNFEADADELAATVLASKNPEKIYLSQLGTAAARNAILQSFDEGASLVNYLGHGAIHLWADENFFNTSDVASLAPQAQQPLLLTMNCLNGYFHFPYFNSLAEELVQAKDKGAIAAFSPSGLSLNGPANLYHKALLQELFNGSHGRLGDAVLAAQEAYAETGAFPELLSIYHLLGDPALTLK